MRHRSISWNSLLYSSTPAARMERSNDRGPRLASQTDHFQIVRVRDKSPLSIFLSTISSKIGSFAIKRTVQKCKFSSLSDSILPLTVLGISQKSSWFWTIFLCEILSLIFTPFFFFFFSFFLFIKLLWLCVKLDLTFFRDSTVLLMDFIEVYRYRCWLRKYQNLSKLWASFESCLLSTSLLKCQILHGLQRVKEQVKVA